MGYSLCRTIEPSWRLDHDSEMEQVSDTCMRRIATKRCVMRRETDTVHKCFVHIEPDLRATRDFIRPFDDISPRNCAPAIDQCCFDNLVFKPQAPAFQCGYFPNDLALFPSNHEHPPELLLSSEDRLIPGETSRKPISPLPIVKQLHLFTAEPGSQHDSQHEERPHSGS